MFYADGGFESLNHQLLTEALEGNTKLSHINHYIL